MKLLISIILFLSIAIHGNAQQGQITRATAPADPFVDSRDGQVYETVRYTVSYPDNSSHSYTWMTRNLNYEMNEAYCYDELAEHCSVYGKLYTWDAAMKACPEGWHLPSDEEWYHLAFHFGGNCSCGDFLKSDADLWKRKDSRGTNESLFQVLPSGMGSKSGTYHRMGWMAIFWSSNDRDEDTAWDWKFTKGAELQRWFGSKQAKNSVRCIKD